MDQVKQMIIACIVSRKGGVPVSEIDNEYRQLVGTKIPYAKYGFLSLEDLMQNIAEIMMVHNPDGSVILKARDSKTSHISSLVERQKTTGNARKKVANCYRMSAPGQNYMRGASSHRNHENNRSNNYRKTENVAPQHVTQQDYSRTMHRKHEMGQLHKLHAENLFKHPSKKEMAQGIEMCEEKYSSKSLHKGKELHSCQTRHPLKTSNRHHFQQRNITDEVEELDSSYEVFDRSQIKEKNQRRISVDDTILVTIVNNYYQSSSNDNSHQRSLLCDGRTGEAEREIQPDHFCRYSSHHHEYSKEFSTVKQKYRTNRSRKGKPVNYYEELYVQKWTEDHTDDDCAENVSGYYIRRDSDYTHHKRDVSRAEPGLLIRVKNEYAIDRHLYTSI